MYAVPRQQRIGSAVAAGVVTAGIGWALLTGLAGGAVRAKVEETLALFRVPPPPPPAKVMPKKQTSSRPSGRAAPPNIRSQATPVVAPPPVVVVPLPPPPIVAAPKPFAGAQATQGAAPRAGPGTGAGGIGDGTGSGGWGDGDGSGDETPPRWRKGRLSDADYPRGAGEAGFEGTVSVRFLVWTDGRVRDCEIDRSSGNRLLDDTTCRLIRQRFRYDPSRDREGRPVPAWILENHSWVIEAAPEER